MATKGVQGPTAERLALAEQVRALRAKGLTHPAIAERLGITPSYASSLWSDPDGSKARARKDRYAGACVDCGAETSGSDGPDAAPERCADCSWTHQHAEKVWTRETVVDAIRRFAAEHGRPPTSTEWIRADPERDYPARSSVYRSKSKPNEPFASWADAIEAAGFPRPHVGSKVVKERIGECRHCGTELRIIGARARYSCEDCQRRLKNESRKRWGRKHPERAREASRRYYERHRDQVLAYSRSYRTRPEVKERIAERARARYARKKAEREAAS